MGLLSFLSGIFRDPSRLAPADFVARERASDPVVDVRSPGEYAREHLKGAINVDIHGPDFDRQVERLVKRGTLRADRPVYLYCRSGARSGRAARLLRGQGFGEAYNVGGIGALKRAGAEVGR